MKKLLLREQRVRESIKIPDILQECLPYQRDFIKHPSKRKAVCGTRRAAKSFMLALYLIDAALNTPKGKFVYMGLTKGSAKNVMWTDIFEIIFAKYKIEATLNSKNEIEFGNGAVIFLGGLDATPKEMNKLRGNAYDIACLDECQDFTQDLKQIIQSVLEMTLAQSQGTLILAGTPGNSLGTHYWWLVNKPDSLENEWTRFKFDWKLNTSIDRKSGIRVCDAIQNMVDEKINKNPLIIETPAFKQEIMGEWVIETSARVYKSKNINYVKELPRDFAKGATYILSLDLGYYDATAFVIGAYNKKYNDNMYILESFKKPKLIITEVAEIIKDLKKKYNFMYHIVDAANTQAVEEMRQQHHLPLEAAEKLGKEAHIALLNSDFITNNVCILKDSNKDLIEELETLIWDQKALLIGKHKESASKDNHLCDALLYAHHASRHYWYQAKATPLTAEEEIDLQIDRQFGAKKKMKQLTTPWWNNREEI